MTTDDCTVGDVGYEVSQLSSGTVTANTLTVLRRGHSDRASRVFQTVLTCQHTHRPTPWTQRQVVESVPDGPDVGRRHRHRQHPHRPTPWTQRQVVQSVPDGPDVGRRHRQRQHTHRPTPWTQRQVVQSVPDGPDVPTHSPSYAVDTCLLYTSPSPRD